MPLRGPERRHAAADLPGRRRDRVSYRAGASARRVVGRRRVSRTSTIATANDQDRPVRRAPTSRTARSARRSARLRAHVRAVVRLRRHRARASRCAASSACRSIATGCTCRVGLVATDESVRRRRAAARHDHCCARRVGYSCHAVAARRGRSTRFTRQDIQRRRRRGQPAPGRRPGRRLSTHEDPVMEEQCVSPARLPVGRQPPQVVADRPGRARRDRRRRARAAAGPRSTSRRRRSASPRRRCRPSCCAASARSTRRSGSARSRSSSSADRCSSASCARRSSTRASRSRTSPAGCAARSVDHQVDQPIGQHATTENGLDSFDLGYTDATPNRAQRIANRLAYVFVEENSKTADRPRREHVGSARTAAAGQPGAADPARGPAAREEGSQHGPASRPDQRQRRRWSTACASQLESILDCSCATEQDRLRWSSRSSRRCGRAPGRRR